MRDIEAQIEAGLERVRSRTLAMHASDELAETAAVVFKQLIGLGISPNRLYIEAGRVSVQQIDPAELSPASSPTRCGGRWSGTGPGWW